MVERCACGEQEAIAESLPDPPNWVECSSERSSDAWDAYRRMRAEALPFVEFPQRDDRRDRRRAWTWGQALIAVWIVAFLLAFWAAVAAIVVEVLT
jgi:hypothetical protein